MINFIKMMALLVIAILASIIKGIGKIFNNVGTVMTSGSDSVQRIKKEKPIGGWYPEYKN